MKYCTKCGYENSDELTYCSNCGAILESKKPEVVIDNTVKHCKKCGYETKGDAEYCIYCGEPFGEKPSNEQQFKYCAKCGNKLSENAVYCTICGSKFGEPDYWTKHKESNKSGLGLAAKILCIISSVCVGFFGLIYVIAMGIGLGVASQEGEYAVVIPLFMFIIIFIAICIVSISMTVSLCRRLKNNQTIGTGFKICILLLVNLIAGILLLCMDE